MKKTLLILFPIAVLAAVCALFTCHAAVWGKHVKGSGHIVTRTLPAMDYDAVSASRAVKVLLSEQAPEIRIAADDNFIDHVVVKEKGGTLQVTIDKSVTNISNTHITVTVPARDGKIHTLDASSCAEIISEVPLLAVRAHLKASSAATIRADYRAGRCTVSASSAAKIVTKIEASGACSFEASSAAGIKAQAEAASCSFEASSSAKIKADIETRKSSATASSAAKIELAGRSAEFEGHASSAAGIHAEELATSRAEVEASSGAGITITCSEELRAQASSGASVRYGGDCRVEATKSSGGSIRKN